MSESDWQYDASNWHWQEKKQDVRIHVLIIIVALHFIGYYGIENVWRDQIFHGVSSL